MFNISIPAKEIRDAVSILKQNGISPTPTKISRFFRGTIDDNRLRCYFLYGLYAQKYSRKELCDHFKEYLKKKEKRQRYVQKSGKRKSQKKRVKSPLQQELYYRELEKLSPVREEIAARRIEMHEADLSLHQGAIRQDYPRAYEPWDRKEDFLLCSAFRFTNDLELLKQYFLRPESELRNRMQHILQKKPTRHSARSKSIEFSFTYKLM